MELWQTEAFKRWWDDDWSWDGLAGKNRRNHLDGYHSEECGSLQDLWRDEADQLVEFGAGAGGKPRRWTRFHLPPFDNVGRPCPQNIWTPAKDAALTILKAMLEAVSEPQPAMTSGAEPTGITRYCDLSGVVVQGDPFPVTRVVADFTGAMFLEEPRFPPDIVARFDRAIFAAWVSLDEARFHDPGAKFAEAVFLSDARFRHTHFFRADFSSATFLGEANFAHAEFENGASFGRADFGGPTIFDVARFAGHGARFYDTRFRSGSSFRGTMFLDDADFDNACFAGDVSFAYARFQFLALFRGAAFEAQASFDNVAFAQAVFRNARFARVARFVEADFDGADFEDAKFMDFLFFNSATFAQTLDLRAPQTEGFAFTRPVYFNKARFREGADFRGRRFLAVSDFSDAAFGRVPLFYGAVLHPETFFSPGAFDLRAPLKRKVRAWIDDAVKKGTRRRLAAWQWFCFRAWFPLVLRFPATQQLRQFIDKEMVSHELAFRTLRLRFAEHQNVEYETMFYGLELDARRARASVPFFFEGLFAFLYKITSNYGQNMLRPALWFLGIWGAGIALLITLLIAMHLVPQTNFAGVVSDSSDWVLRRLMPLPIWDAERSPSWLTNIEVRAPGLITLLRVLLPTTSAGLLTVFLIALRRRFQIDRG